MRILVADLRHRGNEFLPCVLLNAHAHFFTERNVLIPRLLQLTAPVRTMQNVIQRGDGFDHQKVANRRGLRGSNFALVNKTELGKELDGVFTGATGDALNAFLTGDGLQRHRHQGTEPFILHGRVNRHKANRGFIVGIDIQSPNGDEVTLFIHHHLMVRHRIPGVTFRPFRLM